MGITNKIVVQSTVQATVQATNTDPEVKPESGTPCFYTEYDGVGDHFYSAAAAFKDTGPQTFVCEFWFDVGAQDGGLFSNNPLGATTKGIQTFYQGSTDRLFFNGRWGGAWKTTGIQVVTEGAWHTFVATFDTTDSSFWYDGSLVGTIATGAFTPSTDNFYIGMDHYATSRLLQGRIKNFGHYQGKVTNGADWVPGDSGSLTGITGTIYEAPFGNDEGTPARTFTSIGDPTKVAC